MSVAFINKNTPTRTIGGSVSGSFTVSATGPNHIAIIALAWDNSPGLSVASVMLDSMTAIACGTPAFNGNSNNYAAAYYVLNPPPVSTTLAVSIPGAAEIYANLCIFAGVDAIVPILNYTTATPTSGNVNSLVVASSVDQITVSIVDPGGGESLSGTNQTVDGINTQGGDSMGSDHCTTPAASVTHTWTTPAASNSWAMVGFSLQEIQPDRSLRAILRTLGQGRPPRAFRPGIAR